jgi:membrane associated rhomboid family serine protease
MFLVELTLPPYSAASFVSSFAVVPADIHTSLFQGDVAFQPLLSLFTSMFLHGGWVHLLGNMLYLWVFGDNIEDRLGHLGYIGFYLVSGVGAALIEVAAQGNSTTPIIGASGAIAGVLGAYFLSYPRARILTLIPLFIYFPVVEIPAFFFLGFWFIMQFLQGTASLGGEAAGGIAWWAHAGGFLVGAVALPIFLIARKI